MYLILLVLTLLQSVCFRLRTDLVVVWSCGTIPSQGGRDLVVAESTGSCLEGDARATFLHTRSDVRRVLQCMRPAGDGAADNLVFTPDLSPIGRFRGHSDVPLALAIATFLGAVFGDRASGLRRLLGEGTGRVEGSCLVGDAHALLLLARSGVSCVLQSTKATGVGAVDLHVFAPDLYPASLHELAFLFEMFSLSLLLFFFLICLPLFSHSLESFWAQTMHFFSNLR